jgi:hypothetical protein
MLTVKKVRARHAAQAQKIADLRKRLFHRELLIRDLRESLLRQQLINRQIRNQLTP